MTEGRRQYKIIVTYRPHYSPFPLVATLLAYGVSLAVKADKQDDSEDDEEADKQRYGHSDRDLHPHRILVVEPCTHSAENMNR